MPFEKNRDQLQGQEWFPYVLGKLYPIEWMQFVLQPDQEDSQAPRFCWRYFRPDPTAYTRVEQAVRDFRGVILWKLYARPRRCCIAAAARQAAVLPPLDAASQLPEPLSHSVSHFDLGFQAEAVEELPLLCRHIEEHLGLKDTPPNPFQPRITDPQQAKPLPPRDVEDFVEPGMHAVWLVRNPGEFEAHSRPTSRSDRMLCFGLTHEEWHAILFEALGVDQEGWLEANSQSTQTPLRYPTDFKGKVPGYPMISRIRGYLYDVAFETEEVVRLRDECRRAKTRASQATAVRGLDKLLRICAQAIRLGLGIYFASG